jgi:cob(I)alamin adenosyltransferase
MTKIYTKTGDCGTTGTFSHGRMSKADRLAGVLGSLDELNSWVGVCRAQLVVDSGQLIVISKELKRIQNNIMVITTGLAGHPTLKLRNDSEVKHLEKLIDELTEELPPLNKFIYTVGYLQLTRAVCRRAEREVVGLLRTPSPVGVSPSLIKEGEKEGVLKYLNRLSDALFTMGRWVNFKTGVKEEKWES